MLRIAIAAAALALTGTTGPPSVQLRRSRDADRARDLRQPQISTLDEQTAGLYFRIISSCAPAATVSQVKASQVKFLAQRNACGAGYDCLISAYLADHVSENVAGIWGCRPLPTPLLGDDQLKSSIEAASWAMFSPRS